MLVLLSAPAAQVAATSSGPAPDGRTPRDLALAILHRENCQTQLPLGGTTVVSGEAADRNLAGGPALKLHLPAVAGLPGLATLLLVAVAAIAVGAVLLSLRRAAEELPRLEPPQPRNGHDARGRELPDHRWLAGQGRFAEAIHALLLQALRRAERAGPQARSAAPSWTTREVLGSDALGPEVRRALGPLVATVESVYFGAAPAGMDEYRASLAQLEAVEAACRTTR